ncbi:DUF2752 domain-containing protein [Aegicerativicinus sediminis]
MASEQFMLPCLNKSLFGFECMGCGLQRSFWMLFSGDFVGAFYMYPAIYSLILLFVVVIVNHFKSFKYSNIIIISLTILTVLIMVGNYILKLLNY